MFGITVCVVIVVFFLISFFIHHHIYECVCVCVYIGLCESGCERVKSDLLAAIG